jgi:DNA-damage-inducible protein D
MQRGSPKKPEQEIGKGKKGTSQAGIELAANLFRITQTEEKLRKDGVNDRKSANKAHHAVGREVRAAIERVGGTMPEDLPTPEKSIAQIEKERLDELERLGQEGLLILDE